MRESKPTQPITSASPCALFSGGGSGGHVFPGLAIAEALGERGWRTCWMGSEHGMEARLVKERQLPFFAVAARPVVGQGMAGKARALLTLLSSAWTARRIVRQVEARVIIGTGGYVSAPAVLGGRLAGRPILLFEPNAHPGAANRFLSRLATEAAVAFPGTDRQLHCATRLTGIPVRQAFFETVEEAPATPLRLLVLGGSQGARQLNKLLPAALALITDHHPELVVCHQVGAQHVEETRQAYDAQSLQRIRVEIVPFLDDVASAMNRSHLVLSRAGAITLAELCAAGRASILVPLAIAGAHQSGNAEKMEEAGASRVLVPNAASPERLAALLDDLLSNPDRRRGMAAAASRLGRAQAAAAIADRIEVLGGADV